MESIIIPGMLYITEKKVVEFYNKHKSIDINKINLKLVEILENSVPYGYKPEQNLAENRAENVTALVEELKKDIKYVLQTTSTDKITDTIKDYMQMFEDKTKILLNKDNTNILQQIFSIKSELNDKVTNIKEITLHNKNEQTQLLNNISQLVQKMGGSSNKGKVSEQTVLQLLYTIYPSADIENVTKQKECGDFIIKREGKYDIMIENKIYNKSVDNKEVSDFLRNGRKNNICGVMLSQEHGISNKKNYQIDIMDNNIYVYIHNVFHDPNKIKIAIDVIDNLKKQIDLLVKEKNICMDKQTLQKINKEYNEIISTKINQQTLLEEYNTNMNKLIESIKLPTLGDFLTENGGSIHINNEYKCDICKRVFTSNTGLQNHNRACIKKQQKKEEDNTVLDIK